MPDKIKEYDLTGNNKEGFVVEDVQVFEQTNYELSIIIIPGRDACQNGLQCR